MLLSGNARGNRAIWQSNMLWWNPVEADGLRLEDIDLFSVSCIIFVPFQGSGSFSFTGIYCLLQTDACKMPLFIDGFSVLCLGNCIINARFVLWILAGVFLGCEGSLSQYPPRWHHWYWILHKAKPPFENTPPPVSMVILFAAFNIKNSNRASHSAHRINCHVPFWVLSTVLPCFEMVFHDS